MGVGCEHPRLDSVAPPFGAEGELVHEQCAEAFDEGLDFSFYWILILLGRVGIFSLDVSGGRVEVLFDTVGGLG